MRNRVKVFSIILFICIAIIGIIYGVITLKNKDKVVYITDNEFLYDVAIDYLKEKYTLESYDKEKEDFQVFFDYKGFGISQKDNEKYAYMWILEESYYLENGKIKTGSGSSMPYKITFVNNKVIDFEIPKDGSYYVSSIRDMFPNDIENKILSFNLDDNNLKKKVDEYYSYTRTSSYSQKATEYEFVGEIIEANENYIIVKPDANSKEIKSSDKISISITRPTDGTNDFYVVGNKVKITYDGTIMESYPAQINATKIELVS